MDLSKQEYQQYVKKMSPPSPLGKDVFRAFWTGGLICVIGQLIQTGWQSAGLDKTAAGTATSASLVQGLAAQTHLHRRSKYGNH